MIRFEDYPILSASIGPENPMPDIKNVSYIHAGYETTPAVTPEDGQYLGKGMIDTLLPYKIQDGYDRDRKERVFKAAILENDYLKAVFLPEIGGRLWSLYDKELGRELLYKNSVYQPANLGLRNAWFSGGVEFNVGIKGHNPLTCSPLYAEVVETAEGPVLSMYEYERIRGVVYTVNAYLPEDSRVLYLHNTIENTTDEVKNMYWWSNMAVPETPKTRVIVPTDRTFICSYSEDHYVLDMGNFPQALGTDSSYPMNVATSRDFFYKIPETSGKWIAAPDENGIGLLQCSTDRLLGRKLFLWGTSTGGRHWNEWLSVPGESYIEIQAGLAHTQLEHIPMEGHSEWSWTEAYTALQVDPASVHGDWYQAIDSVEKYLADRIGDPHALTFPALGKENRTPMMEGSLWGALEEKIRQAPISKYHTFELHQDAQTDFWQCLLDGSIPACPDVSEEPVSYLTDPQIIGYLQNAQPTNWYLQLQLGVALYANKDVEGARAAWKKSIELCPSAWAYRNLAMLTKNEDERPQDAEADLLTAFSLAPNCTALAIETAALLTQIGKDSNWLMLYETLDPQIQQHGRIQLYRAIALIHLDRLEEAAQIIRPEFVLCDIKEGEVSVSHIWFELYHKLYAKETGVDDPAAADAKYPLPRELDFRMH